jgi:acyl-CoA synthetase (AMP-forming)/AMP-acid ligase II
METHHHSMLALLQSHGTTHTDALAHLMPVRDITYRRLWSRIERGSARLQGEWGVRPDDLVAYVGHGHPDAIVLYFSLLRIGASLLPLEAMPAAAMTRALTRHSPVLVLHDDGVTCDAAPSCRLEDLLSVWSHHDPVIADDDMTRRALWLPDGPEQWQHLSLFELSAALPPAPRSGFVNERIFTTDTLCNIVLPSLRDARQIRFAATDPVARTGS